jgi:hypothetical protein
MAQKQPSNGKIVEAKAQDLPSEKKHKAPCVIVKHRDAQGTIMRSVRIMRYWQHKKTGAIVEITGFRRVVPDEVYRVIWRMPEDPLQYTDNFEAFKKEFQPYKNLTSRA